MNDSPDINNLLSLARMEITEKEKEKLDNEIRGILDYIQQVENASVDVDFKTRLGTPYNVMREDSNPHESSLYTDLLLESAPVTKDGYIQVKKIL